MTIPTQILTRSDIEAFLTHHGVEWTDWKEARGYPYPILIITLKSPFIAVGKLKAALWKINGLLNLNFILPPE